MNEQVTIRKTIYSKNGFKNAIDTSFSSLVPQEPAVSVIPAVEVPDFFGYYNNLFYDIPMSGSYSGSSGLSHLDLVNRSSDYIGMSLSDMQNEIIDLRQQNVALRNQIFVLTNNTTGSVSF